MLVWQNSYMKERFWFVYYWIMLAYAGLALFVLVVSLLGFQDRTMKSGLTCDRLTAVNSYGNHASCQQGDNVPDIIIDVNEYLYFDFIDYVYVNGKSRITGLYDSDFIERRVSMERNIRFNNGYPLLIIFIMTLIRWISIGKHIWQRPESS